MAASKAALARHLHRLGRVARVSDGLGYNQFRIDWPDDGGEVLIVIPTKGLRGNKCFKEVVDLAIWYSSIRRGIHDVRY